MNETAAQLVAKGSATPTEALALFDRLEVVGQDELLGRWKGSGFHTGHPMDGLLEACAWYGKEFLSPEAVHPLLFSAGDTIFAVDPRKLPTSVRLPRTPALATLLRAFRWAVRTTRPAARLRQVEYRGKVSAAMIYDDLPTIDVFRRVDADTLLGCMDKKGVEQPLFFVLRRDAVS